MGSDKKSDTTDVGSSTDGSTPISATGSRETKRRQSNLRLRLIHDELDRINLDADERSRSSDNKASFLAVAAGIVVGASATLSEPETLLLGLLPMILSGVSLGLAAVALRPGVRSGVSPELMVAKWLDSEYGVEMVERDLVREKVANFKRREANLRSRAALTAWGFAALLASVATLVVDYAFILSE